MIEFLDKKFDYKNLIDDAVDHHYPQIDFDKEEDLDMYEHFEKILSYAREKGIVPNFTTSGFSMTTEKAKICKKYCGIVTVHMYSRLDMSSDYIAWKRTDAVHKYKNADELPVIFTLGNIEKKAQKIEGGTYIINGEHWGCDELHHITFGRDVKEEYIRIFDEKEQIKRYNVSHGLIAESMPNYTMEAIKMLLQAGVRTNIRYELNTETIDEVILRVKYNGFPKGINAVIFCLHESIGHDLEEQMFSIDDPKVKKFFSLLDMFHGNFQIDFAHQ